MDGSEGSYTIYIKRECVGYRYIGNRHMANESILRLFTLKELESSPKTGYDLMHSLRPLTQGKKISPGTIYPLLRELAEKKLITQTAQGRKKIYSITAKGEKTLHELATHRSVMMRSHMKMLKVISTLHGKKKDKDLIENHICVDEGNAWINYNHDIILAYKKTIQKITQSPFDEKKAKKWRQEIKKQIAFLKNL